MKPNFFVIYVSDVQRSATFYSDLFEMEPTTVSPVFIGYTLEGGVTLGLFSGPPVDFDSHPQRHSELGVEVPGGAAGVQSVWDNWSSKSLKVLEEVHDAGFGSTFLVADPDGNYIRVTPVYEGN